MDFAGDLISGASYACLSLGSLLSTILDTNFAFFSAIFNIVSWLFFTIATMLTAIVKAMLLIAEDFREFLGELFRGIATIFKLLQMAGQGILYIIILIWDSCFNLAFGIETKFTAFFTNVLNLLKYILSSLHMFIMLSGQSVLMILQFLPWTIVFIGTSIVESTTYILRNFVIGCNSTTAAITTTLKSIALNTKDKIYNIPRDAYIGLVIIITILFAHRYLKRQLKHAYRTLKSFSRKSLRTIIKGYRYLYTFIRQRLQNLRLYFSLIIERFRNSNDSGENDDSEPDSFEESEPESEQPGTSSTVVRKQVPRRSNVVKNLKQQLEEHKGAQTCIVCLEQRKNIIFLPCAHLCVCQDCCRVLSNRRAPCPLCRQIIRRTIIVYA